MTRRPDIADLIRRRAAAVVELERITERLDRYPSPELRMARDQVVALVDRLDSKIEAPASS
jgi:hypothetical protein